MRHPNSKATRSQKARGARKESYFFFLVAFFLGAAFLAAAFFFFIIVISLICTLVLPPGSVSARPVNEQYLLPGSDWLAGIGVNVIYPDVGPKNR